MFVILVFVKRSQTRSKRTAGGAKSGAGMRKRQRKNKKVSAQRVFWAVGLCKRRCVNAVQHTGLGSRLLVLVVVVQVRFVDIDDATEDADDTEPEVTAISRRADDARAFECRTFISPSFLNRALVVFVVVIFCGVPGPQHTPLAVLSFDPAISTFLS